MMVVTVGVWRTPVELAMVSRKTCVLAVNGTRGTEVRG